MKRVLQQQHTHRSKPDERSLGTVVSNTSFGTNEEVYDRLVGLGLIDSHPCCRGCNTPFTSHRPRSSLHFSFQCWKCGAKNNLLDGTELKGVKKIGLFFAVAINWVSNGKTTTLLGETGIDPKTLADYRKRLRNVMVKTFERMTKEEMMLGGDGVIVEVDECKLFSPKYHRGHPPTSKDVWVVGVIERDATNGRRSAFLLTNTRGADVLVPFIKEWVKEGSVLMSDCWRGYTDELDGYVLHERFNHSEEFAHVVVINGNEVSANTNHIEREWLEVRRVLMCKGPERYEEELAMEMFRLRFLAGKPVNEQAYVLMKKMAALKK